MRRPSTLIPLLMILPLLGFGCTTVSDETEPPAVTPEITQEGALSFTPDPILANSPVTSDIRIPAGDVLSLAQSSEDATYEQAVALGGEIIPVDNNRSFVVWWEPEDFDPAIDTVIVALHGHASWATRGLIVWSEVLKERHYAYLGPQWWFGRTLESAGYYKPDVIYGLIRDELRDRGIPPGHVIFQGFSMGSANSYAVTAFDKWEGDNFFAVTISNAGVYEEDFPPNEKISTYSELPYQDTHWILYCAMNDQEHPDWNRCAAFDETQKVIEDFGGIVDLYIKDPTGDHGSFMMNKDNLTQALDVADSLIQ